MTVSLESEVPHEDQNASGQSGDGECSPDGSSEKDEIVVVDDSDDDDVVFVSSTKENEIEEDQQLDPLGHKTPPSKPLNVVKPFGFERTNETEDLDGYDEDDEDSEHYYRHLYKEYEKEESGNSASSSDDFDIHDLFEDTPYHPKQLEVKLEELSDETIRNYSMVKDCCVCVQNLRPRQGVKRRKRPLSDDEENDPLYIPYEPSTSGKKGKRKQSSDDSSDPAYPDEPSGPTKDLSVYQNIPLNKLDANRSRITFCDRVIDFVECSKLPKIAAELCKGFWENLNIRTKRKYLPRSKYALCSYGVDDPQVQHLMSES